MSKNLRFLFIEDNVGPLEQAVKEALDWGLDQREIVGLLVSKPGESSTWEHAAAPFAQIWTG